MTQQERTQQSTPAGRREHRMQRRKLDILKVAARLFAEQGYERATLDMIAEELGLSKPGLYYYVKSKEDILAAIFEEIFHSILQRVQADVSADLEPRLRLRRLIIAYVLQACIYPEGRILFLYESYLLSICNPELRDLRDRYQRLVEETISEGIKKGIFRTRDAKLATLALVGAVHAIPLWYVPDGPLSPREIGEYYADLLIGGLVTPLERHEQRSPTSRG
jgi:AcrR family transcriptional regulator